jgi:hypothetical protein
MSCRLLDENSLYHSLISRSDFSYDTSYTISLGRICLLKKKLIVLFERNF